MRSEVSLGDPESLPVKGCLVLLNENFKYWNASTTRNLGTWLAAGTFRPQLATSSAASPWRLIHTNRLEIARKSNQYSVSVSTGRILKANKHVGSAFGPTGMSSKKHNIPCTSHGWSNSFDRSAKLSQPSGSRVSTCGRSRDLSKASKRLKRIKNNDPLR